jgi:ribosome-binding ATPase YchF (GTP1/OBG family)
LPNVGKSTLFNLLTNTSKAKVGNFPFCTIEPNVVSVPYVDLRLKELSDKTQSEKTLYSTLNFVDIAGLVRNASNGEGLGNQFLSHISEVDCIIHVVRNFEEDSVSHVVGRIDPTEDLDIILTELALYDLKRIDNMKKKNKALDFGIYEDAIKAGTKTEDNPFNFLSLKPSLVVCNGCTDDKLTKFTKEKNLFLMHCEVQELEDWRMELNIGEDEDLNKLKERAELLTDVTLLINKCFDLLNIIHYFTTGPKETRAWMIKKGTNARDAAGEIHTDFIKKFIAADVIHYNEYPTSKLCGKDYIVQDGDIIVFRIA